MSIRPMGPSQAGLAAAYATPLGNRVLLCGTSVEAQNGTGTDTIDPTTASAAVSGRGWFNWANSFLGHRMKLVYNGGISGSTSAQQLAALPALLATYPSDWVFLGAPVNDPATGILSSVTIPNLTAMLDLIRASGRRTMILTCIPSTNYQVNSGNKQALSDVNRFIRSLPFTRGDVDVVDAYRLNVDPATGGPGTNLSDGVVHPSDAGALRIGREVANVMAGRFAARPPHMLAATDPRAVIAGAAFPSNGSGWSILGGAGVAAAYATATDRIGNAATLTLSGITDNADHGIQYVEPVGGGRYAAGDVVKASARFQFSNMVPVGVKSSFWPFLRIWPRQADGTFTLNPGLAFLTASSDQAAAISGVPASGDIVVATFNVTLPATVANLYVAVGWTGAASGTVVVSDLAAYKVN